MPRQARLLVPGFPLHIIQHGHNKQACFHDDGDYLFYLHWLRTYGPLAGMSLHAYVLMTNHIHLLASFENIERVSVMMKALAQRYTAYKNKRLVRCGAFWHGRFFSCPVPTERYFLTCQRYIELNPVRATMVSSVDQYLWSSYRANAGLRADTHLQPHPPYQGLGATVDERCHAYRMLFADDLPAADIAELRHATNSNRIPGAPRLARGRRATFNRTAPAPAVDARAWR